MLYFTENADEAASRGEFFMGWAWLVPGWLLGPQVGLATGPVTAFHNHKAHIQTHTNTYKHTQHTYAYTFTQAGGSGLSMLIPSRVTAFHSYKGCHPPPVFICQFYVAKRPL